MDGSRLIARVIPGERLGGERTPGGAGDAAPLAIVVAITALYAWLYVDFSLPPLEDAAILMRYARHFAAGAGMVWNVGEPPVDGATDFLFVVVVGALHRLGLSLEHAVLAPAVGAHFATVALVYAGLRRQGAGAFVAGATALYVALGPGLAISAACFGATLFAFVLALAWVVGQEIVFGHRRRWLACFCFALTALVAALLRPEGSVMALLMTAGLCVALPWRTALRLALAVAAVFLALGGPYFLWRWDYFGHPLPNPFYRRGSFRFEAHQWQAARGNAIRLCWPFLFAYASGLAARRNWRLTVGFAIPWLGFVAAWAFFSNDMNFAGRYQYPLLPIAALSWYPLVRTLPQDLGLSAAMAQRQWLRLGIAFLALLAVGGALLSQLAISQRIRRVREGNYEMAMLLNRYADRGYALATTEAGLLPLYSQWRTLDTWGLNDAGIAQRGRLTEDDLERYRPAVVMWHDYGSPVMPPPAHRVGPWVDMIATLQDYVDRRGFVLAAAFGREPRESHYYWVDAELRDCAELVAAIRALSYAWPRGGAPAVDFAAGRPGRECGAAR